MPVDNRPATAVAPDVKPREAWWHQLTEATVTIALAALSALGYCMAYAYEFGFCSHFGIPTELVQIRLVNALVALPITCLFMFAVSLLLLVPANLLVLFIAIIGRLHLENLLVPRLAKRIGREIFAHWQFFTTVFATGTLAVFPYLVGEAVAELQRDFYVATAQSDQSPIPRDSAWVVLRFNDGEAIAAPFDIAQGIVRREIHVVPINSGVVLRETRLGRLKAEKWPTKNGKPPPAGGALTNIAERTVRQLPVNTAGESAKDGTAAPDGGKPTLPAEVSGGNIPSNR